MPTLIKYLTLHIGLLRRETETDLVTVNADGAIGYYLATITDNHIELHSGFPVAFNPAPTDLSDSEIQP